MTAFRDHTSRGPRPFTSAAPVRLVLLVLAMIFAVEAVLMAVLPHFEALKRSPLLLLLVDSSLLVAVLCPAVWVLVVNPIRRLAQERGELLRQQITIQERERARLGRELHDELGQTQTAILLMAKAAMNSEDPAVLRDRAAAIHELAASAIESTRRLARGLSPSVLHDFGLGAALSRIVEDHAALAAGEIDLKENLEGERFPTEVEICVYRAVQEAIVNALRHADATRIGVTVVRDPGGLRFEVTDDGRGIEPQRAGAGAMSGLGLRGMRERVTSLGGVLVVEARSGGGGTRVAGFLPVEAPAS